MFCCVITLHNINCLKRKFSGEYFSEINYEKNSILWNQRSSKVQLKVLKNIEILFLITLIWCFLRIKLFLWDKPFLFILIECNVRKNEILLF